MNRYIKILSLLLTAILITCFLCGCGSNDKKKETTNTTTEKTVTTTETTVTTTTEEETTVFQGELAGRKIVVDAGHGCTVDYMEPIAPGLDPTNPEGPGTGTCGVSTGTPEKDLTLQVALRLQKALEEKGAEVVMIRSTEGTEYSLEQRSEVGNNSGADFSIRIHADGLDDHSVSGTSVLYPSPQYVGEEVSSESKVIAQYLLDSYCSETQLNNRGLSERGDLTGFNFSTIPVVLIELGFMTNPEEDVKMSQPEFQDKMVQGMVSGVTEYYNNK